MENNTKSPVAKKEWYKGHGLPKERLSTAETTKGQGVKKKAKLRAQREAAEAVKGVGAMRKCYGYMVPAAWEMRSAKRGMGWSWQRSEDGWLSRTLPHEHSALGAATVL